jgi:hypothetical protein
MRCSFDICQPCVLCSSHVSVALVKLESKAKTELLAPRAKMTQAQGDGLEPRLQRPVHIHPFYPCLTLVHLPESGFRAPRPGRQAPLRPQDTCTDSLFYFPLDLRLRARFEGAPPVSSLD